MRLPKDTDSWTPTHVDKLIELALRRFDDYEKRRGVDDNAADQSYRAYQVYADMAKDAANIVGHRRDDVARLP